MKKSVIMNVAVKASFTLFLLFGLSGSMRAQLKADASAPGQTRIEQAVKLNPTTVEIKFTNQQKMLIDFYGNNIFRMFQDDSGKGLRDPQADPQAQILVNNPRKPLAGLDVTDNNNTVTLATSAVQLTFDKNSTHFTIRNLKTNQTVVKSIQPVAFEKNEYEYVGIDQLNVKWMQNLTNDRLHTNGDKVVYPTFVNLGNEAPLEGNKTLFVLKFKAKRAVKFNLAPKQGLMVDKFLNTISF